MTFRVFSQVIAVIDAFSPGSHAEFVLAEESSCAPKPLSMSHIDAAAFPYAACTVWSALISVKKFFMYAVNNLFHALSFR